MPTRVVLEESQRTAIRRERDPNTVRRGRFRSSLLRSVIDLTPERNAVYTSATDIRASPRLSGYLYTLIASFVMVASVIQFYRNEGFGSDFFKYNNTDNKFILVGGARVFYWKFIGAFLVSFTGTISSLIIILAHFDTFFFPRFWRKVFKDGSIYEYYLLVVNCIFWAVGVHICTSSFSIGATQANVFFTTWIGFISSALTFDTWRRCADLQNVSEFVHRHRMTTVFNWTWTLMFSLVTAGAMTGMYLNRKYYVFYLDGQVFQPSIKEWDQALWVAWTSVGVSLVAVAAKLRFTPWGRGMFFLEGFTILAFVGVYVWICTNYTGVAGAIAGPSNAYFGVWGVFFTSLITFGTWLRENHGVKRLQSFRLRKSKRDLTDRHARLPTKNTFR